MLPSTTREEDRLIVRATAPHFFKVVLDNTIRDKKLEIPKNFVMKYGYDLPNTVLLKVPSDDAWRVELVTCNGKIWLQKGWQEFMEFYSIVRGYFLVFQYDRVNCYFNVIIFDPSASEIDYPCKSEPEAAVNLEEDFVETRVEQVENNNDFVEILNGYSLSRKRKEKSPLSDACTLKKVKAQDPIVPFEGRRGNESMRSKKEEINGAISETQELTTDGKGEVLDRANATFKSKNPFFTAVMQPSYIDPGKEVTIEAGFARKYLKKGRGCATLNVMDGGRTWSVKYSYSKHGRRTKARFRHGWNKFVYDNRLNFGDVCVFDLISHKQITFRVIIYRNLRNGDSCLSFDNSKVVDSLLKAPNTEAAGTLPSPSFEVFIKSDNMRRFLYVPGEFMKKFIRQNIKNIKLEVKNKQWDVKLINYGSRGLLSAGWPVFARENCLQAGDVCIFKLVNARTKVLEVSISRRNVN